MNKLFNLTYASSLTDICEINSSFDSGVLRICYTGKNRNNSSISKEVMTNAIPTIYNCPVVCNYDPETNELGGHDMAITKDDDGNLRLMNVTYPVGLIPESSKVWFEDYEEEDGTVHEYLYAEVLLWKRQEAYKKIKEDGITSHSMEINVKDGHKEDGVFVIDDFEFNAFCLISETPCFESSALEMFSMNELKSKISEMMQDYKDTFNLVSSSNEDDNIQLKKSSEGGQNILDEKKELAAKYGIDINSLDFSLDDFSIEELKEKFEAIKNSDNNDSNTQSAEKFALNSNTVEELRRSLMSEKYVTEWGNGEMPRYSYCDCDASVPEVYAWDCADGLLYGFPFTVNGDAVAIDFSCKTRKKFTIVDFNDGDVQGSPVEEIFSAANESMKNYADIEAKYSKATEKIEAMETELDELKKFKKDVVEAEEAEKRNEVFSKFSNLDGIDEYEKLKDDCMKFDLAALEEKCYAILGKNASMLKFSKEDLKPRYKAPDTTFDDVDSHDDDKPYGGIVEKYAKKKNHR